MYRRAKHCKLHFDAGHAENGQIPSAMPVIVIPLILVQATTGEEDLHPDARFGFPAGPAAADAIRATRQAGACRLGAPRSKHKRLQWERPCCPVQRGSHATDQVPLP